MLKAAEQIYYNNYGGTKHNVTTSLQSLGRVGRKYKRNLEASLNPKKSKRKLKS